MEITEKTKINIKPSPQAPSWQEPKPTDSPITPTQAIQALAFLRLWQIIGNKKATPPIAPLLPISRSKLYADIKLGKFPAPVKISARVSAWRGEDIRKFLEALGRGEAI